MDCESLSGCPFFNGRLPMEQGFGSIFIKKYCKGNNHLRARYKIICEVGEKYVPGNLYPNMMDIASSIITSIKNQSSEDNKEK